MDQVPPAGHSRGRKSTGCFFMVHLRPDASERRATNSCGPLSWPQVMLPDAPGAKEGGPRKWQRYQRLT
jgi:hypothetical protein